MYVCTTVRWASSHVSERCRIIVCAPTFEGDVLAETYGELDISKSWVLLVILVSGCTSSFCFAGKYSISSHHGAGDDPIVPERHTASAPHIRCVAASFSWFLCMFTSLKIASTPQPLPLNISYIMSSSSIQLSITQSAVQGSGAALMIPACKMATHTACEDAN
jgi:hypothetical protein